MHLLNGNAVIGHMDVRERVARINEVFLDLIHKKIWEPLPTSRLAFIPYLDSSLAVSTDQGTTRVSDIVKTFCSSDSRRNKTMVG